MNGISTISPLFAILFTLVGFALAILLGLALYPNKRQERASSRESFEVHEDVKAG